MSGALPTAPSHREGADVAEELPFAPRRKRPLSLRNPLDYLLLLYWVFFFPQALRWYVERFGTAPKDAGTFTVLRKTRIHRQLVIQTEALVAIEERVKWHLVIQAVLLVVVFASGFLVLAPVLGIEVAPWGVALGVAVGAAFGLAGGVVGGVTLGVALGGALGMSLGVVLGVAAGVVAGAADGITLGIAFVVTTSVAFGVAFGVALSVESGVPIRVPVAVAGGVVASLAVALTFGLTFGLLGAVEFGLAAGMGFSMTASVVGLALGMAFAISFGTVLTRPELAILALAPTLLKRSKAIAIQAQRASPIPIPGLANDLAESLRADWVAGLRNCEGLLRYSLQFIPVIGAIERTLATADRASLIPMLVAWCDLGLSDWKAMRYQSASLRNGLAKWFFEGFLFLPRRWRPDPEDALRYDTPARAACAGFWLLHKGYPTLAAQAFGHVGDYAFGAELHTNAQALAHARGCADFAAIADWSPPTHPGPDLLRPGVAAVLKLLGAIAWDARLVLHSRSPRERNSALNRVIGGLRALQQDAAACPQPERVVVGRIVWGWLDLALGVASDVGSIGTRLPVSSPYITGAPVPAERLVGREAVFDQLRAAWDKPGQRDSLVVYGHRRMGKTSVLRNLLAFCDFGAATGLAFLNLQTVDWSEPLADLCRAIAFTLWSASPGGRPEPDPRAFDQAPLDALRRFLAGWHAQTPSHRAILVLDEYELLDEQLPPADAARFIALLRGLTQQYPWLVVALVGLHVLKERSASFYQAIYAWRPVRVSFLDAGGVADLLQVDSDVFPLAYSPEVLAEIHRITGGQPFLVQLVGDGLVQGFNRRLREDLHPPAATLDLPDLEALVAGDALFEQGTVYFRGIWEQAATGGQQAVLRALAPHPEGLDEAALGAACGLTGPGLAESALAAALGALIDHDVLAAGSGRYAFTVELMRRWVADGRMDA
jgi:hypothetical protein